jgi:peptide/nickel transport system substrate-binding protein
VDEHKPLSDSTAQAAGANVVAGKSTRRELIVRAGLAVGGVALAGHGGVATAARKRVLKPSASRSNELIVAISSEPPSLFQNLEDEPQAYSIYDAIFEYLVKSDPLQPTKGPLPALAVSWKPVGKTVWQFNLRKGVKFHNGEDWDAEAAKFNLDTVLSIKPPSPFVSRIAQFKRAEVKDKYTLLIHTKGSWATAPLGLSEIQMGAPAFLKQVGPQQFAQQPVGTGPFKFAEWKKGQAITLERNPDYWGPKARLDRLVFRGIPDVETRFAALQANEIQIQTDLNVNDVATARKKGFRVASTRVAQSILMTPYIVDAKKKHHPMGNPKIRLAMNHAINRPQIVKSVLRGFGPSLSGQVTGPDAFGFDPTIKEYRYDPGKAKSLLRDAGFPKGIDLGTFWVGVPGQFLKQREFVEVLISQFAAVGIKLAPRFVEYATFLRMALQEHNLYYIHQGGWQYYPVMDASFALQWYSMDHNSFIHTGLGVPHFDAVFHASEREFNVAKRQRLLRQCQRIIHNLPGPITLWQHVQIFGVNPKVTGFTPTPDERIHFKSISMKS